MKSIPLNEFVFDTEEKTIMDVMGNTKDENMCSNMLAFYFNPNEEHRLKNLVLKALIDVLINKRIIDKYDYSNIAVTRELKTINKNRIDIVIKNNECVIGIENKIDANLYNDLNDYSKSLDSILETNAIKIVLSINEVDTNYDETGFINIRYNEFLTSLINIMKDLENSNNKWYLYLEDFVLNLIDNRIEHNVKKYLFQNNINLEKTPDYYKAEIETKVMNFKKIIESRKKDKKSINVPQQFKDFDLTAYILLEGFNLDARLTLRGWEIGIFVYKKSKIFEARDYLRNNNINIISERNQHFWIKEFKYDESIDVVANYYLNIYNLIKRL